MQATTFSISARAIAALFVFSIGSACGERPGESPDSSLLHADSAGARAFVKSFYDWYGEGRLEEALGRDSLFAPQLASLLKEDLRLAGADTITPRMTLDGDPFVGQDPCLPYIPIGLAQKGDRFRVTMWPHCAGRNNPWGQPSTIEVARVDGQWKIFDVYYGTEAKSLMDWLCEYAMADTRPDNRPAKCSRPKIWIQ